MDAQCWCLLLAMIVSFTTASVLMYSVVLLQVYVKLSAFFRVSREPFPYKDTWQMLKQLRDTYGADRLMWGRFISNHEMLQLKVYSPKARFLCHNYETAEQIMAPQMQSKLARLLL
jgi:hypothetical protein